LGGLFGGVNVQAALQMSPYAPHGSERARFGAVWLWDVIASIAEPPSPSVYSHPFKASASPSATLEAPTNSPRGSERARFVPVVVRPRHVQYRAPIAPPCPPHTTYTPSTPSAAIGVPLYSLSFSGRARIVPTGLCSFCTSLPSHHHPRCLSTLSTLHHLPLQHSKQPATPHVGPRACQLLPTVLRPRHVQYRAPIALPTLRTLHQLPPRLSEYPCIP
jgi:hypothetical protein